MRVFITEWALNSYLELRGSHVFSDQEYWLTIRPDILRLKVFPNDPKFSQAKFWSPARDDNQVRLAGGYKMKWHQVGNGCVQLRLTIGILDNKCYLCEAYVKENNKVDKRKLAIFKTYLQLIQMNRYIVRGELK